MLEGILSNTERAAVEELSKRLRLRYKVARLIVFGSKARGDANEESDLDILVLTFDKATHALRNEMSDVVFEINLEYGTNISIVVIDNESWENGPMVFSPLHQAVSKEGITLYEST